MVPGEFFALGQLSAVPPEAARGAAFGFGAVMGIGDEAGELASRDRVFAEQEGLGQRDLTLGFVGTASRRIRRGTLLKSARFDADQLEHLPAPEIEVDGSATFGAQGRDAAEREQREESKRGAGAGERGGTHVLPVLRCV